MTVNKIISFFRSVFGNVFIAVVLPVSVICDFPGNTVPMENKVSPVEYVNANFENASPLFWENLPDGTAMIHILYDHERNSPNRASNHVFFEVQAKPRSDVTLKIQYFDEIWNGRIVSSHSLVKNYYVSVDGKEWNTVTAELTENGHIVNFNMKIGKIYVAGMEPYRISDLDKLIGEIKGNPLVSIQPIGKTVEGRQLEIIRIGKEDAPYSVFIRARAHPWEAGGNWVVQGLIRNLLNNPQLPYSDRFAVYIMPMANKDGVAHGYTRFNCMGWDLNRNMNLPADPFLAPENLALENWMKQMAEKGIKPDIVMDLHNDRNGKLDFGNPEKVNLEDYSTIKLTASLQDSYTVLEKNIDIKKYNSNTRKFESLMYKHTWYTWKENNVLKDSANSENYNEKRFDADISCLLELNQVWIEGLKKVPFGKDWELMGKQLCDVFYYYFE